ncbi:MAG: ABC transporter permease [Actinomycetes bacterium]
MTATAIDSTTTSTHPPDQPASTPVLHALGTLARRRLMLSARTPRELLVPLITPILFALVIAPALARMIPDGGGNGLDYRTFVAVGTVGLLIPLSCTFAGIGVIVDRENGARRELLAAPIPRSLLVLSNLLVALLISSLQIVALVVAALARGSNFHTSASGIIWAGAAAVLFAIGSYGLAEILAVRLPRQEEYIGATPAVAILPWFLAGSLFPIAALPTGLTWVAKALPLSHALAVIRYGVLDGRGSGLHDIWGMDDVTAMAALSLSVCAAWAVLLTVASIRLFTRSAVQ